MQVKSPEFGTVEVADDRVIEFPAGLPGFEQCRRFVLVHEEGREAEVFLLQSADDPDVAFSITAPIRLGVNLEFTLSDEDVALLQLDSIDDVAVAIIVRSQGADETGPAGAGLSANFMAPLVINTRARRGMQKVISRLGCEITLRQQG
ncbi:flagellar assembly protein FliW [Thauera linaloolentis]|uniref:Flagellar assembly factor FliW n=1 Tax=Thauera linaloolentis (strain DSM 12138 / JCM 21573 / CCUG 41526 / CIP 105981 / IAM 15112 / NBRC 102519 / 47Lol) TaxID=1123367 RepID=N6YWG2_THAL4|nr:flagellar assembly protein FliW [Thauera linaloolentis]ENO84294.1 flagellar assembly protein FliW [Thauera linaloolentis 47Lol = DSM 12138]MCM8567181.1 flagellar assembly protein FliW [Thauera linaloolentis]